MRSNEAWRFDANHITQTANQARANELCIYGYTIRMKLTSIDFPRSFVLNSMHVFYINAILGPFNHYRGKFFS